MTRQVLVRYKVKPERIEEHEQRVREVFAELQRTAPQGIRYGAFKREDGVSFVHLARITADHNPLDGIAAFRAFTERIRDRCDEPPQVDELTEIGAYDL